MSTRALLHVPASARRGDIVEVRATLAHPMETGYRRDADGRLLPRNIVERIECRYDGELVFAADTHAAIAANPYLAFHLRVTASGTLTLRWTGQRGFVHSESRRIEVL